jgi:hypothetical protein
MLSVLTLLSPIFTLNAAEGVLELKGLTFTHLAEFNLCFYPIGSLIAAAILLTLITIGLFKNRKLQIKVSYLNLIVNLLLVAYVVFSYIQLSQSEGSEVSINTGAYMPIIVLFFIIITIKLIKRDENLVNSLNRLR